MPRTTRRRPTYKQFIDRLVETTKRGQPTGRMLTLRNVGNKLLMYLGQPVKTNRIKDARVVEGYIQNEYTFDLPSDWNLCEPPRFDEQRGITIHAEQVGSDRVVAVRKAGLFEMSEVWG
jgi:hypothetical protein